MMNTPIHKKSLAHEVADKIKNSIKSEQYAVNEKLPAEPDLMQQYGVGRSTIREAVRMLANSGLLKVQQGIGTFIANTVEDRESLHQRLNRADSKDIDEIRQLLEIRIAQKAALNRSQAQLEQMESFLNARHRASLDGNIEECVQADINFHLSIAKASGNEMLAEMYEAFTSQLKSWFLKVYTNTNNFIVTNELHRALFESIKNSDADKAFFYAQEILKD